MMMLHLYIDNTNEGVVFGLGITAPYVHVQMYILYTMSYIHVHVHVQHFTQECRCHLTLTTSTPT